MDRVDHKEQAVVLGYPNVVEGDTVLTGTSAEVNLIVRGLQTLRGQLIISEIGLGTRDGRTDNTPTLTRSFPELRRVEELLASISVPNYVTEKSDS